MKETKVCTACKVEKPRNEFHLLSHKTGYVQSKCKICRAKYQKSRYLLTAEKQRERRIEYRSTPEGKRQRKLYYESNKEDIISKVRKWESKPENKVKRSEYYKEYNQKTVAKEYRKEYYIKNKDKIKIRVKEYAKNNKDKYKARHQERRRVDPAYVIKHRLRSRLYNLIKSIGGKEFKKESVMRLVGCDMETLKEHIEGKFINGMSWERFIEMQIDHIRPCASFDLTDIEQQKACFHYTNLQPLWAEDNGSKGAKYNGVNYRKMTPKP